MVAKYEVQGLRVTAMNQERFGAAMKADMAMWGKVVNATGFTTQNESIVLPSTACMMAAPQYEPLFRYTAFCYSRPSI